MLNKFFIKTIVLFTAAALIFICGSTLLSQPSRYENKIVNKIEFKGLVNAEKEDLKEVMVTTEGYPLKSEEVRADIKKLFSLGHFENIEVEIAEYGKGVKLRFLVTERSLVEKVVFKGYSELLENDLYEAFKVKEGEVYRKDQIKQGIVSIREKYKSEGFFNAYVTYRVKKGDKKKGVAIEVIIDEGEEVAVKKFAILGINSLPPDNVYGLLETKEEGIFNEGLFKKDVFEADKQKILGYYRQEGYLDAQIVDEKFEYEWNDPVKKTGRVIFIVLKISEGERYYFEDKYTINFSQGESKVLSKEEIEKLKRKFQLKKKGELFNNSKFMMDRQSIGLLYASKGYIFSRVVPKKKITEKVVKTEKGQERRKYVKVDFYISEGNKAYIEKIIIKGNEKTREKVIRRELLVKEGELFNQAKVQRSREIIFNLGYFKQVNIDVRPGSRQRHMNLIVDVEEQPTGTISLGGGYGTTSGFSIFTDVTEKNLFGTGKTVGVKLEYGPEKTAVTLSYKDRWFFDTPLGFNASIFLYEYEYETSSIFASEDENATYKKRGLGYSTGLNYRFWSYWTVGTTWVQVYKKYFDPSGNSPDDVFENVERDWQLKNTMKFYLARSTVNNYLNPTRGTKTNFTVAVTGGPAFRGDDHYIMYSPSFSAYYSPFHLPFLKSHPTAIEFRASGDFIAKPWGRSWLNKNKPYSENNWIEEDDRLEIGGTETVRGWDDEDSSLPDSWRYVGLYHRILYGAEFRIPIHPQMLWMAFFFDAGSLWSDKFWEEQLDEDYKEYVDQDLESGELRRINDIFEGDLLSYFIYSYGFGFKVQIPMMPLRFWFGKKMIYEDGFKTISGYNFQFAIGDIRF